MNPIFAPSRYSLRLSISLRCNSLLFTPPQWSHGLPVMSARPRRWDRRYTGRRLPSALRAQEASHGCGNISNGFPQVAKRFFAARFALDEDLEDFVVINRHT